MAERIIIAHTDKTEGGFIESMTAGSGFSARTVFTKLPDFALLKNELLSYMPEILILGGGYMDLFSKCEELLPFADIYLMDNGADSSSLGSPADITKVCAMLESIGYENYKKLNKLKIDYKNCSVFANDNEYPLTTNEMDVLKCFMANPNRVFSREQLAFEVFGTDAGECKSRIETAVTTLKDKLDGVSSSWNIKAMWGVGYKFEVSGK